MCYEWWEEQLRQERERLAKEQADFLERLAETALAPPKAQPTTEPKDQPDPVPV